MFLYIKFYINNKQNHNKFLFWSCVLDTICTKVDYDYLNRDNEYNLLDSKNLSIIQEFSKFSFDELDSDDSYKKRNPVFLSKDDAFETGSPYKDCCCNLITYYRSPNSYVTELKNFFTDLLDYEILEIQKAAIKRIKDLIGFDLTKAASYPGCISIFEPLPSFSVSANLKQKNINIISKTSITDYIVEIEGFSVESSIKSKTVFRRLYYSENRKELNIHIPDDIETFYTLHVSIFSKENETVICLYENTFHGVKNISFGMNLKSGNSTLLKNRFLNNRIEKKELSEHHSSFSVGNEEDDFTDWDRAYNQYFIGKEKRWLDSKYFFKTDTEKNEFLKWIRLVLSDAKNVYLVDPFLSVNGFNDFVSCYNSYFSLTVVTTDPTVVERRDDKNKESEKIAEYIYNEFPSSKVYYVNKEALHDRYLIVESANETKYYSFSNSWQGLLKDYSLFVQEVDYESSLKLKADYEKIIKENSPVAKPNNTTEIKEYESEKYEEKLSINRAIEAVRKLTSSYSVDPIIETFCSLFKAADHWWQVIDYFDAAYKNIQSCKKELIHVLVNKLLNNEKENFAYKRRFAVGKKFSEYNTAEVIIERIRTNCSYGHSYYDLGLDYAQYCLLSCIFLYADDLVISELEQQENEIFKIKIEKTKQCFYVSELIISSILGEHFGIVNEKNISKAIEFANRTKYSYCRLYVAEGIYNGYSNKDFSETIKYIEQTPLTDEEWICFLYTMYTSKIFASCKTEEERNYSGKIEQYVHDKFVNKDLKYILQFARQAYFVVLKKLNLQGFENFVALFNEENKKEIREKTYLFFLLYAVRMAQNNKLYDFFRKELNIETCFFDCVENQKDIRSMYEESEFLYKKSVVDISEFRSQIPLLATALANEISKKENVAEAAQKLVYKFDIQKKLLTGTCSYYDAGLDYFSLLIILHALYLLREKCSQINEIVSKIEWYVPLLLNSAPDDFYHFSYSFIGIYFQFINEDNKQVLLEKLSDIRIKILCMSMQKNLPDSYIAEYECFFSSFTIPEDYDKSKNLFYALNVFVNLCLIEHNETEKNKEKLLNICKRIESLISVDNNPELESILKNGIIYLQNRSESSRNNLLKSMDGNFFPYSILNSVDEGNEK